MIIPLNFGEIIMATAFPPDYTELPVDPAPPVLPAPPERPVIATAFLDFRCDPCQVFWRQESKYDTRTGATMKSELPVPRCWVCGRFGRKAFR